MLLVVEPDREQGGNESMATTPKLHDVKLTLQVMRVRVITNRRCGSRRTV